MPMMHPLARPLRLRTLEPEVDRRVTWLELFFDLVFVAAVSQVGNPLACDYSVVGFLRYAFFFLMIWWAWLGHTTFSTRFDPDDLVQRALTLAQMFFGAVMAVNAADAFDSRDSAGFIAAYAAMRLIQAAQYLRASRLPESRPLSTLYLRGFGVAAALWLVSAVVPVPLRFALWAVALAIDFTTPLLAEAHSPRVPPDGAHLPERYGLFTIILIGESVVRVMHGMESQAGWSVAAATCALGGLGVTFAVWWWYFDGVHGAAERRVRSARDALRLRIWSYAHLPLYLALAVAGIGLEHAIEVADHAVLEAGEAWLLAGSLAAAMLAITAVYATGDELPDTLRTRRVVAGHVVLAASTLGLGALGADLTPAAFVILLTVSCAAQMALTVRASARRPEVEVMLELA